MNQWILVIIFIFSHVAFGATPEGAGVTAGGLTEQGVLADLIDHDDRPNCIEGTKFFKDLPSFSKVIEMFKAGNVAFSGDFERKANSMSICRSTKDLNESIVSRNQKGVYKSTRDYDQVAIWVSNKDGSKVQVFLDEKIYNSMDEVNQSFLMVHETMNFFLNPDPEATYINRMWYFISDIYSYFKNGTKPTPAKLKSIFDMYDVKYPRPVDRFLNNVKNLSNLDFEYNGQLYQQIDEKDEVLVDAFYSTGSQDYYADTVIFLVSLGLDINKMNIFHEKDGEIWFASQPLHHTITEKNYKAFEALIGLGADVNGGKIWEDKFYSHLNSLTFPYHGVRKFHGRAMKLLLDSGELDLNEVKRVYEKFKGRKYYTADQTVILEMLSKYLNEEK